MPTGFTKGVSEGRVTDFRTFALLCARAMSACIMQREEASDVPPKLQEPSDYYLKATAKAEAEVQLFAAMTIEEAAAAMAEEAAEQDARVAKYRAKQRESGERYRAMLDQVNQWNPPTKDHEGLREFMVTQLTESIQFECQDYTITRDVLTPEQWLEQHRAKAADNVRLFTAEYEKEVQRTAERNAWIQALYDSLPPAEVQAKAPAETHGEVQA